MVPLRRITGVACGLAVLIADASVRKMSAAEYAAAPKPSTPKK
jgi:hypothetical protein